MSSKSGWRLALGSVYAVVVGAVEMSVFHGLVGRNTGHPLAVGALPELDELPLLDQLPLLVAAPPTPLLLLVVPVLPPAPVAVLAPAPVLLLPAPVPVAPVPAVELFSLPHPAAARRMVEHAPRDCVPSMEPSSHAWVVLGRGASATERSTRPACYAEKGSTCRSASGT